MFVQQAKQPGIPGCFEQYKGERRKEKKGSNKMEKSCPYTIIVSHRVYIVK